MRATTAAAFNNRVLPALAALAPENPALLGCRW